MLGSITSILTNTSFSSYKKEMPTPYWMPFLT